MRSGPPTTSSMSGPGAGVHGGEIVAEGTPAEIAANPNSLTGHYLSGERTVAIPLKRRARDPGRELEIVGARGNNLKDVTATIPLGLFTCVTGVSGGGKSTLVIDTLYKAAARKPERRERAARRRTTRIEGLGEIDKVIDIDQSPIGRTPRSNPATYTGAFTPIRDWFAGLPEAKARGYLPGRFSFNVKGGRCEACQGDGVIKIEMHFPARRLCHLRRVQGQALRPRDARECATRQIDRRRARHDGRGGGGIVQGGAVARPTAGPARSSPPPPSTAPTWWWRRRTTAATWSRPY